MSGEPLRLLIVDDDLGVGAILVVTALIGACRPTSAKAHEMAREICLRRSLERLERVGVPAFDIYACMETEERLILYGR